METGTLFGYIAFVVVVLVVIMIDFHHMTVTPSNIKYFFDVHAIMLVFGGGFSSTMLSYPMGMVFHCYSMLGKVWKAKKTPFVETLTLIIDVSRIARKNILAIEEALPNIENKFLRGSLRLVVDRVDRRLITDMMEHEIRFFRAEGLEDFKALRQLGALGPGWGMLGTLVGMILLLQNLSDPSSIGPSMGIALAATLYGSIAANIIFNPAANKIEKFHGLDVLLMEIIRDGVLYIEQGERPDFIELDLINYLPESEKHMYEQLREKSQGAGGGE